MASNRFWKIEGYEGTDRTFMKTVPVESLTERGAIVLLQRLSARHLDDDEIISSSLRQNSPDYTPLLEPQITPGKRRMISVGANPYYVASIWHTHELSVSEMS